MSGSTTYSITPFTDAEKVDVRRFTGYPAYGNSASDFISYRFFQAEGTLEYRLNNLAPAELQVVRQYLAQLYVMESAIPVAANSLSTDQAAVWVRNKNEVDDRDALFNMWRRRLCTFLGMPPGPALRSNQQFDVVV